MKKIILIAGALLLSLTTSCIADKGDELEIRLVDDSNKSKLKQEHIVGCNDHLKKKELTCSKEPEEIILSKLPTSSQLDETDFDREKDLEKIKAQLNNVMEELAKLKKAREQDKKIIEKLSNLIDVLSKEKESKQKKRVVKSGIENIIKKNVKKRRSRYIPREIKILEKYDDYVLIEVQRGESLSSYAEAFYGNQNKYYKIYKANRDRISKNMEVIIGDKLIIPLH